MRSRPGEVARLAGVRLAEVRPASADQVRHAYADRVPFDVLEVVCTGLAETGEPCYYWQVGNTCYLDDATFGDVVAIDNLRYDGTFGLYSSLWPK